MVAGLRLVLLKLSENVRTREYVKTELVCSNADVVGACLWNGVCVA